MGKKIFLVLVFVLLILIVSICYFSKDGKRPEVAAIGFSNLENLFDTINDADLLYNEEFTPQSEKQWTSLRYKEKLSNLAQVISKLATYSTSDGLAILGVCEVENRAVLEDLVMQPAIINRNYQIVHYDSPDARGIDVGLLFNPDYFEVINSRTYSLTLPSDSSFRTRDQLVVSGLIDGEVYSVIVNHWPSRRGGEEGSRYKRIAAANLTRRIVDSLQSIDKNARILVMGDFNDDPINESIDSYLNANGNINDLRIEELYNPMLQLFEGGVGTLKHRGKWNLFDMILISQGLINIDTPGYKYSSVAIFNREYLLQGEGKYKGYPNRTYGGKKYLGGFSDHLPVYLLLRVSR